MGPVLCPWGLITVPLQREGLACLCRTRTRAALTGTAGLAAVANSWRCVCRAVCVVILLSSSTGMPPCVYVWCVCMGMPVWPACCWPVCLPVYCIDTALTVCMRGLVCFAFLCARNHLLAHERALPRVHVSMRVSLHVSMCDNDVCMCV